LGKAAKAGEITFMFLSPTDYVELHKSAEIEAIATKKNKGNTPFCQGTLIAPTTSDIRSIADLKGKSFCFGAKGSFNKYYAALAAFKEQGFDHEKELTGVVFGSDCDGIGECIMKGEANAGVVCDYSWDGWAANPKGNLDPKKFVIIGRGPKLREEVVAVPAFVKQEVRKQILDVLIALDGNPAILKAPVKATGFVASTDKDYDDLRAVLSAVTK
jgi:phosphonate transport system substrate-binding protein